MPVVTALGALLGGAAATAVVLALGARLRGLARAAVSPGLRIPVDLALGGWAIGLAVLAAGLAGLLRPWLLLTIWVAAAAAGRWRARRGWRPLPPALVGCAVTLPVALAPPFFYDALVYHLGLPWQALLEGGWRAHGENVFAAFPPLAQLLYTAPLAAGAERVPAVLHWASVVAAAVALRALARRLGASDRLADLAAATLALQPALTMVAGLPAAEGWTLAPLLAAAALALGRRSPGGAGLVGVLLGVAVAARLQGVPWALAVGVVAVVRARPRRSAAWRAALGLLAGSAPWWVKNLVLLGEPTAPLGWDRPGLETLWRDAGSHLDLIARPSALAGQVGPALVPHLPYLLPLLLAAVLAVVGGRRAPRWALGLGLFGLAAWGTTGTLPRFLAPGVALLIALAAAAGRTPMRRLAAWLAVGATAGIGLALNLGQLGALDLALAFARPAAAVEADLVVNDPLPAYRAAAALPADARALLVGEARGYRFPRRFVAPSQHDPSPLRELLGRDGPPAEVCRQLRRDGYTHLVVNWPELARLAPLYPAAPWPDDAGRRRWQRLLGALGPPVLALPPVTVLAVGTCADAVPGAPGV
ncbi:MAG: hypothetical protein H6Q02_457 [Acidobacteria bacterium]|jgi:hypothetical protein|nr:hypothetical protein [Acidobacteriota bacterium]